MKNTNYLYSNFGYSFFQIKIWKAILFLKISFLLVSGFSQNPIIYSDSTFVDLIKLDSTFVLDIKYATEDNFLKEKVYDCGRCYLRFKTAKALVTAQKELLSKGYRIRIYDCYRPLDVQKKMFKLVPNPKYVASPTSGSVHNRGAAVDLTLETLEGDVLDMGTEFDFFGPESSINYNNLSKEVLNNRNLLKQVMINNGFDPINSEWWHFNLRIEEKYPISNFKWDCN